MKKQYIISAIITILFIGTVGAQTLKKRNSLAKNEKSFFEIKKSFENYWAPYHVTNGYYIENGIKKKADGWKQFKRWEYYWETRVNPTTGAFPNTSAAEIHAALRNQRGTRASTGNWKSLGPSSSTGGYEGLGRINCVGFRNGDNNTYYAGAPSGGLWKTTDNGSSWTVLTDNNDVLGVSDVVIFAGATTANDTLYIATGDRDGGSMHTLESGNWNDNNSIGVLKSTDGGTSWNTTGLTFPASDKKLVNRLLADPSNHNILYAATSEGIYKTTNGGTSWNLITNNSFVDIEFKPGNSQTIYASTRVGHIYLTTDAGSNWSVRFNKYNDGARRVNLAVSAANPSNVYAVIANESGGLYGIYKSTDSGSSYSLVYNTTNLLSKESNGSGTSGQGDYDLAIAVKPNDSNTLYVGGINTHKSTNGGTNWTEVNHWNTSGSTPVVHADKHMLKFRSSDNTLFETNDGGIYLTTDGGSSWTDKTNGIVHSQLYRIGLAATSSTEIIAGLQDNGTKYLSGNTWAAATGGDGMECAIDYTDVNTQYGSGCNGDFKKTTDHWSSSTLISSGISETGYWVTPFAIDPNNHLVLYMGRDNVWKSTDQGDSWTKISTMSSSSKLRSLAVAPSNSQVIYTADPSHIWVTLNGGTSWTDVTGTLPVASSSITYISVKNDDSATVWVSMGQYNSDGVYQSTNAGTTWTNISTGLPEIPVMCVIQNKQETGQIQLYAGTDLGVYVKNGNGNWSTFNSGLPNVVVNELEIYYNNVQPALSRLRAATSGRGLWESELYSPPDSPPIAEFTANTTNPGVNQEVSFSDLSANLPTSWKWSFSPATIQYTQGTSSTSQNPIVKFSATGNYTVQLIASNSYGSDTINTIDYIEVKQLLSYCTASGGLIDEYISGVQLEDINNTGTGQDKYKDYTNLSTHLTVGNTYNITVTNGDSYKNDDLGVWIDWNQDGDFEDNNEKIVCQVNGGGQGTFSFTVPDSTKLNSTTMRVRIKYDGDDCGSPCGTVSSGEVEDYKIIVDAGTTIWQGTTLQWNSAANWSSGAIPTSAYNVTIPVAPTGGNFPTIPVGYTGKCNKLILKNGAIITINGDLDIEQQ